MKRRDVHLPISAGFQWTFVGRALHLADISRENLSMLDLECQVEVRKDLAHEAMLSTAEAYDNAAAFLVLGLGHFLF